MARANGMWQSTLLLVLLIGASQTELGSAHNGEDHSAHAPAPKAAAPKSQYSARPRLIVFGDSLSDCGSESFGASSVIQEFLNTTEDFPPKPYFDGRATNGLVFPEVAAQLLGVEVVGYAASGATVSRAVTQSDLDVLSPPYVGPPGLVQVPVPTAEEQVEMFLDNDNVRPTDVFHILIGGNDITQRLIGNTNASILDIAGPVAGILETLYEAGAKKVILVNIIPAQFAPATALTAPLLGLSVSNASALVEGVLKGYNGLLAALANGFPRTHPGVKIWLFDSFTAGSDIVKNAAKLGFTAPSFQPCLVPDPQPVLLSAGTACKDPDAHIFWDDQHPTARVHKLLGELYAKQFAYDVFGMPLVAAAGRKMLRV